jgi:anti-sigma-K factor RskA
LSLNLASADHHITQLNSALTTATGATNQALINAALATPGHLNVNLSGSHSASLARFVLLNGQGYLVSSNMATLPSNETYQLWGIINGKPISIGLMGNKPVTVSFTFAGSKSPSEIAVTIEPAGGSVAPTSPIVAAGKVTV